MSAEVILEEAAAAGSSRYDIQFLDDRYGRNTLIVKLVGAGKRVLELGCSTGYISRRLTEAGCTVVGLEVDEVAASAASKFCSSVIIADLNQSSWVDRISQQFDVVIMGDVLEHLISPANVLRAAAPLLRPDGYAVISLPNIVHWTIRTKVFFGYFEYEPAGILDFTHLRFFTLRAVRALVENSGYQIVEFWPVIGGRLSGHFRPLWQLLAKAFPQLFSYQFLIRAMPILDQSG